MRNAGILALAAMLGLMMGCDNDDGTSGWTKATSTTTDGTTSVDSGTTTDTAQAVDSGTTATGDAAALDATPTDGAASDAVGDVASDGVAHGGDVAGDVAVSDAADTAAPGDISAADVADGDALGCVPQVILTKATTANHVPVDQPPTYDTYPPSSGDHFAEWAVWGKAEGVVPAPYWVHNLEHGGIVLLYRCDGDCTALVDELTALMEAAAPDSDCAGVPPGKKILLTEDPCLPEGINVAAVAWEWAYVSPCLVSKGIEGFILEHYDMGPEPGCEQGTYVAPADSPTVCP